MPSNSADGESLTQVRGLPEPVLDRVEKVVGRLRARWPGRGCVEDSDALASERSIRATQEQAGMHKAGVYRFQLECAV